MAQNTVKAVVSHNQEIDGKSYKAGDPVSLGADLARVLSGRGSIKIQQERESVKAAPVTKEVSK